MAAPGGLRTTMHKKIDKLSFTTYVQWGLSGARSGSSGGGVEMVLMCFINLSTRSLLAGWATFGGVVTFLVNMWASYIYWGVRATMHMYVYSVTPQITHLKCLYHLSNTCLTRIYLTSKRAQLLGVVGFKQFPPFVYLQQQKNLCITSKSTHNEH